MKSWCKYPPSRKSSQTAVHEDSDLSLLIAAAKPQPLEGLTVARPHPLHTLPHHSPHVLLTNRVEGLQVHVDGPLGLGIQTEKSVEKCQDTLV